MWCSLEGRPILTGYPPVKLGSWENISQGIRANHFQIMESRESSELGGKMIWRYLWNYQAQVWFESDFSFLCNHHLMSTHSANFWSYDGVKQEGSIAGPHSCNCCSISTIKGSQFGWLATTGRSQLQFPSFLQSCHHHLQFSLSALDKHNQWWSCQDVANSDYGTVSCIGFA